MLKRLRRWAVRWLRNNLEAEIGGAELVRDLDNERRAAIIVQENHPTFGNAWGCLNCNVIQVRPKGWVCQVCKSEEILNLAMQLQRGAARIEKRRKEVRRVTSQF